MLNTVKSLGEKLKYYLLIDRSYKQTHCNKCLYAIIL